MTRELTEQEIRAVYAVAMAYDNRKLSEANITAWWEQANRNRWTFDEAREAIHEHHRNSTEFLMPAHITAIIRAGRRQPEHYNERQLPAAPPADSQRIGDVLAQLAKMLGWKSAHQSRRDPALSVPCPWPPCRAGVGQLCALQVTHGSHRGEYLPMRKPHPSRVAWAKKFNGEVAS